jgi:hypothetical protein
VINPMQMMPGISTGNLQQAMAWPKLYQQAMAQAQAQSRLHGGLPPMQMAPAQPVNLGQSMGFSPQSMGGLARGAAGLLAPQRTPQMPQGGLMTGDKKPAPMEPGFLGLLRNWFGSGGGAKGPGPSAGLMGPPMLGDMY